MGLIDILIAGLCLNATCSLRNEESFLLRKERELFRKNAAELRSEHLRITTITNGMLSGYKLNNGSVLGTGVAFDIINILQKKYGFSYSVIIPDDDTFDGENKRNGSVSNMLLNEKADVAAAFIPVTYETSVTYSRNLDTAQWVVLMKRPPGSATGSGLLAPFTTVVWIYIVVSVLAMGPALYVIMYFRYRLCKGNQNLVYSLQKCMWFVYGALLKQGSTLSPVTDSSRLLFSTWWIFITILTAFYTANLTAFLTLSIFTLPITQPSDIKAKNYKWVTSKGNGIIRNVQRDSVLRADIGYPKEEANSLNDTFILDKYVTDKDLMYIREKIILQHIMYENYNKRRAQQIEETKRCTFVITTFPIATLPRAFAFSPGFKYQQLFDLTIQDLVEAGIVSFKQELDIPEITICPLNLGNSERRLRNSDLIMTYKIVGGGLILSTIIFFTEMLIHLCKCDSRFGRNQRTSAWADSVNNNIEASKKYTTPPPPYSTLFKQIGLADQANIKKMINGREYLVVNNQFGSTNLIPYRAPSALLFQFTH